MEKMKVVLKEKPGPGAVIGEKEIPSPGPNEVLVKVKATSICGTDFHIYNWDAWSAKRIKPPRVFGHEFTGEIVEKGKDVKMVKIGDRISAETHIVCGKCYQCRTGNAHVCQDVRILGVDIDGTFAEYVKIPEENAWRIPEKMPDEIASIMEPFGNAVHTVFRDEITAKDVLVLGCGPIGLMAIAVTKARGAKRIFATELNPKRLELAKKMGADFTFNPKDTEIKEAILDITHGEGVDVILEMSGSESALREGLSVIKPAGWVGLLGLYKQDIKIDMNELVIFKGVTLYGVVGRRMYETWYQATALVEEGNVDLSPVVTHKLKLEEIKEGMEIIRKGEGAKIVLYP